jgi:hypothetical protein
MPTIADLAARIALAQQNVRVETIRVVKEVAVEIVNTLVDNTPVDTSQALSNWQLSIGGPIQSTRPAIAVGKFGSTRAISATATKAEGAGNVQGFVIGIPIHITNNLPYIQGLNDGTISRQPSGFVQKAMLVGRDHLKLVKVSI